MFDILFGWRKASKCKKLIKTVQCRLKLLKNKRSCIVNQLREDVAQLLKHGHHQLAFDRVEQVIMDESMVQVYDLLDQFCEFIVLHIPYIRKHRDCPNDINEAASTLIFSSARFGELPELLPIRKLFRERYGQRFIITALELLPGNLVNQQIKENLYMKKVSDDVKYRLLDEIASSCIQPGPLFLEYKPELQEDQLANKGCGKISSNEVEIHNDNEAQLYIGRETDGKIIYVDLPSEDRKMSKEPCFRLGIQDSEMEKFTVSHHEALQCQQLNLESSSENSAKLPEEIVYLDDIEEFVSPMSRDGILQDQRLFMFKSFGIPLKEKTDYGIDIYLEEQKLSRENWISRSSRKTRKAINRKRTRTRSVSQENKNMMEIECATYYGASDESSPDRNMNLVHERRKSSYSARRTKGHRSLDLTKKCNLEHPCYLYCKDENEVKTENFMMHSLNERKIQNGLEFCKYSHTGEAEDNGIGEQNEPPEFRAMTMPVERPKESLTDNINRSKSFPFELSHSRYSSCPHIHPKLPDYDELAAKFMELKRANLENKSQSCNAQT